MGQVKARRDILRNLLWGNINVSVRYITSFVAVAVIARSLSPEDFGLYQLALTYVIVFENINILNSQHLRNYLVNVPDDEDVVVRCWVRQTLFFWLAFSFFSLAMASFGSVSDRWLWVIVLLASTRLLFKIWDFAQLLLDVRLRSDLVQKIQTLSFASFNIARIIVAFFGGGVVALSVVSGFQGFLTAIYERSLLRGAVTVKKASWSWQKYWNLVRGGFLLSIVGMFGMLQVRLVSVIVAERMSLADYGNLQLVLRLIEPATSLGMVVFGSNYTVLAHTLKASPELFIKRFSKIVSITLVLVSAVVCAILLFPSNLLIVFFGEPFAKAVSSLGLGCGIVVSTLILNITVLWDQLKNRYANVAFRYLVIVIIYFVIVFSWKGPLELESVLWLQALAPIIGIALSYCLSWVYSVASKAERSK